MMAGNKAQQAKKSSAHVCWVTPASASITQQQRQQISWCTLLLVAVVVGCASPAASYPSGAPESACKDLKPGHGVEPQSGESPFELVQDKLHAEQAADQIKVTLGSASKTNFRGLLVQAVNEKGEPIGRFLTGKGLKTLDSCSAVTHSDNEAKKTATLVWEAPSELKSRQTISFKATVVVKMDEIYMGIKSKLATTSSSS